MLIVKNVVVVVVAVVEVAVVVVLVTPSTTEPKMTLLKTMDKLQKLKEHTESAGGKSAYKGKFLYTNSNLRNPPFAMNH